MNLFRRLLAKKLRDNGGYSSRDGSFPIEYMVGLYYADLGLDHLLEKAIEQGEVTREEIEDQAVRAHLEAEYHPERMWQWVQEDLARSLNDNDGYRTYSEKTAARYGLPCTIRQIGWQRINGHYLQRTTVTPERLSSASELIKQRCDNYLYFDVQFELHGRGGKHLVVESFEGVRLRGATSEHLAELIEEEGHDAFSNEWCRYLLAMMEEWEQCFTSKKASDEMEYQAAWQVARVARVFIDEAEKEQIEAVRCVAVMHL